MTAKTAAATTAATRPFKLALVGTLPPWKGISPYCEALTRALAATDNIEIEFLDFAALYPKLLYPGESMVRAGETAPGDLPGHVRHRPVLHYRRLKDAYQVGRKLNAEVLHVQFWSEFLTPTMAMVIDGFRAGSGESGGGGEPGGGRRAVVMTLHNLAPHEAAGRSVLKQLAQAWKAPFGQEALRRADAWVVHYAAGRDELAARLPGVKRERIEVIPHGLLAPRANVGAGARPAGRAAARAALHGSLPGFDPARPLLLLVGNLRAYKGVNVAIEALGLAHGAAAGAQLLVAGARWKDFDLRRHQRLASALQIDQRVLWRAEFVPDSDLRTYLAAADALLLPYTRFDAMSGVASLGLQAGLPSIVSQVGGLPEMLPPGPVRERLTVPPGDAAALARAIEAVLGDEGLRKAAAEPPAAFVQQFAWSTIAAQTRGLYARVLGG